MGLLDAKYLASLGLREAALLYDAVDLQREMGFEPLPLGIGEAEIRSHDDAILDLLVGKYLS